MRITPKKQLHIAVTLTISQSHVPRTSLKAQRDYFKAVSVIMEKQGGTQQGQEVMICPVNDQFLRRVHGCCPFAQLIINEATLVEKYEKLTNSFKRKKTGLLTYTSGFSRSQKHLLI